MRARLVARRRRTLAILVAVAAVVGLYVVVPQLAGAEQTWQRIRDGSPAWLLGAAVLEAASFGGYIWLLRVVAAPLAWRDALQITLAGVAATRIVTVAGAGGIAVTIAGLRRGGLTTREAAERQAIDLVVLYAVFFGLMVLDGLVLAVLGGRHAGLTVVPALLGATIIGLAGAMALVPGSFERALRRRLGRRFGAIGAVPGVVAAGMRGALVLARRRERGLAGALAWWVFDVAALWASVRAFGGSVAPPELLMAYLVGHAFNVLPVPGGVGPVEGGMIAALVAFGEPAGLALVGVLSYQVVSVWLPALPGALALVRLRRMKPATEGPRPESVSAR
ncbi:MAG: putative heme transporter [Solirubrobacteraceae bacterium]|jgi:uncharacterized membrane protein YbhN (UPF0104 family)|nr:putative heme transporter [Solirubrobacteraceae bacterium]